MAGRSLPSKGVCPFLRARAARLRGFTLDAVRNRRVRLLGTAPCRDYRRSNVTARRRGPVMRHQVDARMAAFSCAGRSRSLRRVASSARTRSSERLRSSASLLFSSTIVLSRSTSASSARIPASRPESILGCTSGIGDATGGPRRAAIPDAFVSRLANSKAFWMYHHLHSSRLQRQGRKTSSRRSYCLRTSRPSTRATAR